MRCKLFVSVLCVSFTHMFDSHELKKPLHGLFYSVFQRQGKKILKTDLDSLDNTLQGLPTSRIYHAILRRKPWFSDYFFLIIVLHQFSRAKKHNTGQSDQRSSECWVNIRIWDEFQATTMLYITVCKFWHFFFAPKSSWFPARFLPTKRPKMT